MMGYDFVPEVHDLLWAQFFKPDPSKPWAQQTYIVKRLILWARGHYKTTAIMVFIVCLILNFSDIRILIMQGSVPTTKTLLHQIKCHFNGENPNSRIPELFPEFCVLNKRLGTAMNFTVPCRVNKGLAQATVTVASSKSIKTGQHYDIGFFDDLVNESNYKSAPQLAKVKTDFMLCMPLLDNPYFAVVSGTRYAFGDLYEEIQRHNKGEWQISITDCWKDGDPEKGPRFPQQPSRLDPNRLVGFTTDSLLNMRDADPEMFCCQMLNRPAQRGGQKLTKALLESALINPEDAPPLSAAIFFIDTASTTNEWSNESVVIVGKHDQMMTQYVVDCAGGKWGSPELAQSIIEMALRHRPERIFIEKTPTSVVFTEFLKLMCKYRGIYLPIELLKRDGQLDAKDIRIASIEPMIKIKKLRIFRGIRHWDKIVEECGRWPGGKNTLDDFPDTIALMVKTLGGETLMQTITRAPSNTILAIAAQVQAEEDSIAKDPLPDDGMDGFYF
jgi:hypothetical protein